MTTQSIAIGSPLTKETFDDFVTRLRYHCEGEGVSDHCTADALFVVQRLVYEDGIDAEYAEGTEIYLPDSCSTWWSMDEFWKGQDKSDKARINHRARKLFETKFDGLAQYEQKEVLEELGYIVSGWRSRWEGISYHFTKEAADAWIKRKSHDYRDGLRVYAEAQIYCWEFNTIKEAILAGRLVLKEIT